MPTNWQTAQIKFEGGLISNLSSVQQGMEAPGSATRLVNFEPSIGGGYGRIQGYNKWDSAEVTGSGQVWGVGFYDGEVLTARNGNVYRGSGSGWTSIATGRTHTTKHRYHNYNLNGTRKIGAVDGSNYPYSWDGSSFVNINGSVDILGANHMVDFKDHMFYAAGDLVTFSVPFDETDFTVADGAGNFRMPGEVTGMIVFRERLFIFTEEEIKVLDGDSVSDFRLTSVTTDVGCVARDTIQEVGGDVAFLGPDGVRFLGGTDRIGDFSNLSASRQIQTEFNQFEKDYTQFSSLVIRDKSQYRIFGWDSALSPRNSTGYIGTQFESQNPQSVRWGQTLGIKVYGSVSRVYQGQEYVIFCGEDGFVYRMEQGSDFDGTAIFATCWLPYNPFENPTMRTTMYKARVYLDPTGDVNGQLNINFDLGDINKIQPPVIPFAAQFQSGIWGQMVWGSNTWSASPDLSINLPLVGAGFTAAMQFQFEGGDPFNLDALYINYTQEDFR